jgi:hypothetical protein
MRFGDSPRLALELGLFSALEAAHDLSAWVARLESLEKRLAAGGGGPALAKPAAAAARAPEPLRPDAPAPAPLPVPAAPGGVSWPAFVDAVSKQKIALGATLAKCAHAVRPDGGWTIKFSKPFDLESAQRSQTFLEEALAALAGRPLTIELALGGAAPAPATDIVDTAIPEMPAGGAPEGTRWKDVTEGPGDGGGLKKAEGVFGGKARVVKKPQ